LRASAVTRPELTAAHEVDWLRRAQLDTLDEVRCFMAWAARLGAGERNLGEASVLAAAELREGVAITDDGDARKVARAHGAKVHGTIWLLAAACRSGKQTETAAGNVIDALRATDARLPCSGADFPTFARRHGLL
jgi:predicted nucleic acid-binding protein